MPRLHVVHDAVGHKDGRHFFVPAGIDPIVDHRARSNVLFQTPPMRRRKKQMIHIGKPTCALRLHKIRMPRERVPLPRRRNALSPAPLFPFHLIANDRIGRQPRQPHAPLPIPRILHLQTPHRLAPLHLYIIHPISYPGRTNQPPLALRKHGRQQRLHGARHSLRLRSHIH